MESLRENKIKIRSIENSLNFIKEYLQLIEEKIPEDLTDDDLDTTFDYIDKEFGDAYYKEKKIKKPAQIFGVMNLGSVNAILCTLESRLHEDDGSSWCGIDEKVNQVRTVRDWVNLNKSLTKSALRYAFDDLEHLENFGESIWDWRGDEEDPLSSPRAGELLKSAERLSETAVKRIVDAKQNTWIVIPHKKEEEYNAY